MTGHAWVPKPTVNEVRIRLDTSGGFGTLSACLLRSADDEPIFIRSRDPIREAIAGSAEPMILSGN